MAIAAEVLIAFTSFWIGWDLHDTVTRMRAEPQTRHSPYICTAIYRDGITEHSCSVRGHHTHHCCGIDGVEWIDEPIKEIAAP